MWRYATTRRAAQFVTDKIDLDDVRFTRCSFGLSVPEPRGASLLALER